MIAIIHANYPCSYYRSVKYAPVLICQLDFRPGHELAAATDIGANNAF